MEQTKKTFFNVIINFHGINNPMKVGFCTEIYSNFFTKNKNASIEDAVSFYKETKKTAFLNAIEETKSSIKKDLKTLSFFGENDERLLKKYFNKNGKSKCHSLIETIFYKFFKIGMDFKDGIKNMKNFIEKILSFEIKELLKDGEEYISDLLTYHSIRGTWIENDIKNVLRNQFEIKDSSHEEDLKGIDGWIGNKPISIKSNLFKKGVYQNSSFDKFFKIPIITYKIIGNRDDKKNNNYEIINLKEIIAFYK